MANQQRALEIAVESHKNQKQKDGSPYALHPIRLWQGKNSFPQCRRPARKRHRQNPPMCMNPGGGTLPARPAAGRGSHIARQTKRTACFFESLRMSPGLTDSGALGSVSLVPLSWTEPVVMNCLRSSLLDFSRAKAALKA